MNAGEEAGKAAEARSGTSLKPLKTLMGIPWRAPGACISLLPLRWVPTAPAPLHEPPWHLEVQPLPTTLPFSPLALSLGQHLSPMHHMRRLFSWRGGHAVVEGPRGQAGVSLSSVPVFLQCLPEGPADGKGWLASV